MNLNRGNKGRNDMKKFVVPLMFVACFMMVGCMHMHKFEIEGHHVTQLRTWDCIGPSTVGFYESVDGKLRVYQDSSGNIFGQVAQAAGGAYAGERIGDGLKHQEPDSTSISNELSSEATGGAGGYGEGGAGGAGGTGGAGGNAVSGSVSGAAAGAISNSSSSVKPAAVKPAVKPVSVRKPTAVKPAQQRQNVTVNNRLSQ